MSVLQVRGKFTKNGFKLKNQRSFKKSDIHSKTASGLTIET